MREQDDAPGIDPEIAPLVEALAAVGGPDDRRTEAEILDDLEARAAAISDVLSARARAERLDGLRIEIGRLQESAVAGPEALGALRGKIGETRKALGIDRPQLPDAAAAARALLAAPPATHAPSGVETLDAITDGGWMSGKWHVIAGEPNIGKTSLAVQFARCAVEEGWIVGFHVADVDDRSGILLRIAQAHGLDRRAFLARDPGTLEETALILERWHGRFAVVDEAADGRTVDDTAEALLAQSAALSRHAILFVDSLQTVRLRWPNGQEPRTDKDRVDQVVRRLVEWTRKGLTVVCTCEIPRAFYTGPKKSKFKAAAPPALAAFKGSGNIEYAAWTALVLTRIRGEGEAVRVEVPKNKQGREDVTIKLCRTESRVGYEDAGELHEGGEERDGGGDPTKKPSPGVDPKIVERARAALFLHPAGISGGLDGWATLCGNIPKGRLACKFLLAAEEAEAVQVEGVGRVYRRKGAAPAKSLPAICPICKGLRGGAPGQCMPCATCSGCKHATTDQGGCACF